MRHFFARNSHRVTVAQLPRYSPQYNPIEFLWRKVKKVATHLRYFATFKDLVQKVNQKLEEFTQHPHQISALRLPLARLWPFSIRQARFVGPKNRARILRTRFKGEAECRSNRWPC